jgi:hypothetical protein
MPVRKRAWEPLKGVAASERAPAGQRQACAQQTALIGFRFLCKHFGVLVLLPLALSVVRGPCCDAALLWLAQLGQMALAGSTCVHSVTRRHGKTARAACSPRAPRDGT